MAEREQEIVRLRSQVAKLKSGSRFARARYRLARWINSLTHPYRHLQAFIDKLPDGDFKKNLIIHAERHAGDVIDVFNKTNLKDVLGSDAALWKLQEKAYSETFARINPSGFDKIVQAIVKAFAQTAIWIFPSIIQISKMMMIPIKN